MQEFSEDKSMFRACQKILQQSCRNWIIFSKQ